MTTPKKINRSHKGNGDMAERAYMGIRQMLFHNELTPGQRIFYRDLAERLKMSTTPVIQALKFLEFQDVVRKEPNRGYFTQPLSTTEVEEIYDLRKVIEVSLLKKTFQNLTKEGLRTLEMALEEHLKAAKELFCGEGFNEATLNYELLKDKGFHLSLASLSGCQLQQRMLRNLFDLLYLKYRGSVLFVKLRGHSDEEHQKIFDAIAVGDIQKTSNTLSSHITQFKEHVLACLRRKMERVEEISF